MHLQIILVEFAVCTTLLCLSNAAPPGGSGTEDQSDANTWRSYERDPFTPEEDEFLRTEACENMLKRRNIWNEIAEKHQRNVHNKVRGFEKNRSVEKLKRHFNVNVNVKFPKRTEFNSSPKMYSDQEMEFLNKELLSDSYRNYRLTDDAIWKDVLKKHNLKREQKCKGFTAERTYAAMRYYFMDKMRRAGRVSNEVKARFPQYFETHTEGENDTGESSQSSKRLASYYSSQEDDFIRNEVSSSAQRNEQTSWKSLAEKHASKVENKELGFDITRSADTLRKRFDILKRDLPNWKALPHFHPHRYTKQEEDFINQELLNDDFRSKYLYDNEIWIALSRKHSLKRQEECEGFTQERSANSLRNHFMLSMRVGKRVSKEVRARFPRIFGTPQAGTSTNEEIHPYHETHSREDAVPEEAGEDNEVFGNIISDLNSSQTMVNEDGIDPGLFVDKGFAVDWQNDVFQPYCEDD